jgi:hypothetical protein
LGASRSHAPALGYENIGGHQVAMRDALFVRGIQRIANLGSVF